MKFDSKCAKVCFNTMSRKHGKKNRIRPTQLEKILSWGGQGQENWRNTSRIAQHLDMLVPDGDEPATLQSFQISLQQYLNNKDSTLNTLTDREFLSPGKFFFLKRNSWFLKKWKEITLMLQKNYPTPKKTCCFAQVNLVLKTLKPSNAQFGGYWHCTLDSMPKTKARN